MIRLLSIAMMEHGGMVMLSMCKMVDRKAQSCSYTISTGGHFERDSSLYIESATVLSDMYIVLFNIVHWQKAFTGRNVMNHQFVCNHNCKYRI